MDLNADGENAGELEVKAVPSGSKSVSIIPSAGGVVASDKLIVADSATGDDRTVTLTVTPNSGYALKSGSLIVTYTDSASQQQTLRPKQDEEDETKYTFTMPTYAVTVTAVFKAKQVTPANGEGYTVDRENGKIIPKEGYELRAEMGKFAAKELPLRYDVPYYVRKAETDTMLASEETKFTVVKDECTYTEAVSLTEGTFGLKLGGKDVGWYKFIAVDGGWKIMQSSAPGMMGVHQYPYLAVQDGKLTHTDSENATVWTYKNGTFSTTVKTTQTVKISGGLLGWLFGRGGKTTTKEMTTTYYLSTVIDGEKLSTCRVCAELYAQASGEHEYGCAIYVDEDTHKFVCKHCGKVETEAHKYDDETHKCICGAFDPACVGVKISVEYKEKTSKQFSGFLFWGTWKDVTTYTATVKTEATGVKVTKIEVAESENGCWTKSNTFTSNTEIEKFYVRITTSDGAKQLYMVKSGVAYPAN